MISRRVKTRASAIDVARWVDVAETDCRGQERERRRLLRHRKPFFLATGRVIWGKSRRGKDSAARGLDDDTLVRSTPIHGSLATVAARIEKDLSPRLCCTIQLGTP